MRRYLKIGCTLLISQMIQGCLSTGKDFPSETSWIQKEKTKKNDVRLVLGKPFSVGNSGDTNTWTFAYYKYVLFGDTTHKELKFYWNDNDSVKHFTFESSFPEDIRTANMSRLQEKPKNSF